MSGMYPDNQTISIFGELVQWPGVDEKGKYTNGSFDNPAEKPSFIPAETINLILDNLTSIITKCGGKPNATDISQIADLMTHESVAKGLMMRDEKGRAKVTAPEALDDIARLFELTIAKDDTIAAMKELIWPVGCEYSQHLNNPSPTERGLPGQWEIWSHRADGYGLFSATLPAFTVYTAGAKYAANSYVMYHLDGDDRGIYKAKEAINAALEQLDPVKWDKFTPGVIVERRHLQGWTDEDFEIGYQITDGQYAGWYVCEIIVPGGKFPSVEGGNRPTYITGGVGEDVSRAITGKVDEIHGENPDLANIGEGALRYGNYIKSASPPEGDGGSFGGELIFDSSRVIKTGSENSPRTLTSRHWRRIA